MLAPGAPWAARVARARAALSWHRLTGPSATLIGTTAAINLLRIVNTIVITRLLSPGDFGLIGIVLSIFFVIAMLTDAGFQAFIVRHARGGEPAFLDAVWTIHVARAAINAAVGVMLALPAAAILGKPQLGPLLAVASLTLAIEGCASLSLLTALRTRMVRRLSLVDLAIFLIQLVAGLIAAWVLRSAWALVLAMFVASLTRVAASYILFPNSRHSLTYDKVIAGELWRFSRVIAASSSLTLIISQFDKLVLARLLPLQQFGVYSLANNLATAPTALVHMYASRILYPALAETWRTRREHVRTLYYDLRGIVFYGYLVAAGGLCGAAPLVVGILYDPRYADAGFYLRLLAITAAMSMMTRPMNELLVATGHVRTTFETNVVRIAWLALAAPIGLVWLGPIGLVAALALIEIPAYAFAAWSMKRHDLFRGAQEVRAFLTIAAGILLGLLAVRIVPVPLWRW